MHTSSTGGMKHPQIPPAKYALRCTYSNIMDEHGSVFLESDISCNPDGVQVDTLCMLVSWKVTAPSALAKLPL
eukprot:1136551-Pelagomonas_calceolata.AAC.5